MRAGLIAYIAGLALAAWAPHPNADAGQVLLATAAGLALAASFQRGRLRRSGLLLACLLWGLAWHLVWAGGRLDRQIDPGLEGVDMQVSGIVHSLPRRYDDYQQFLFRITESRFDFHPRRILLNHYGAESIEAGRAYRFEVRLNRPRGMANPGVFDYEAWLFQRGVAARGYVRGGVEKLPEQRGAPLVALRAAIREGILRQNPAPATRGIILALVLGDSSGLSDAQWELFQRTGTNHLFVISGLHIGLVCLLAWGLTLALARRCTPLLLLAPAQKIALLPALAAAGGYAAISGFGLPAQRALVMAAVLMFTALFNQRQAVSLRFLLAMAVVLSLNPLGFLGMGFWLSFLAVGALLLTQRPVQANQGLGGWLRRSLKPQLAVALALFAPLLFWTGQASLLGPLVNLAAIPLVGLVIVPLCLMATCCLLFSETVAELLFALAQWLLRGLLAGLESAAELGANLTLVTPSASDAPSLALTALACLLLLLPRGFPARRIAVILLLPLLFAPDRKGREDLLRLHVLDVGQGLAVLVETRRHALLYDTGASFSPDASMGDRIVLPVLDALAVRRLDAVVISHADDDHSGGFAAIAAAMPMDRVYSSFDLPASPVAPWPCRDYVNWRWDGVEFRFLHPAAPRDTDNNNSCVLQIRAGDFRVLLPGDIEAGVERELAAGYRRELRSDVLLAAHHGSNTSSSWPFLKMTDPDYIVFAAGYRNAFGHPAARVIERASFFTSHLLNTSELGMTSLVLPADGNPVRMASFRRDHPRYWRSRVPREVRSRPK